MLSDVDFERRAVYSYRVIATDAGQPRRSTASLLDVELIDADDELPRFDVTEYHFLVAENRPVGTEVGRVEAVDRDSTPQFRRVFYFTQTEDDEEEHASKFLTLDPLSGTIRTAAVLDRELVTSLRLRVFASTPAVDGRQQEVTSSSRCDVIVGVVDANDNAPEFRFPNDDNYTVLVDAAAVAGSRLARLDAADRDDGINANLTFFVDNGDRHLGLGVESTSGLSNDED